MKNILLFRSAKHTIIKSCIKSINAYNNDCIIWLCVQEQCKDIYKEYNNIQFIIFPNGMYSYEKTIENQEICNKLKDVVFDDIYIPCNSLASNYDEVENIIFKIVNKKIAIYYDAEGKIHKKKICSKTINTTKLFKNICEFVDYTVMKIIYFCIIRIKNG